MKKSIHKYKIIKVFQLCFLTVLEVTCLVVLLTNKVLRSSVFADKSLFILCAVSYLMFLSSYGFMIYDFAKVHELKTNSKVLESLAYIDERTGIPNRNGLNAFMATYTTPESMQGIGFILTQIANIRDINAAHGKQFGDKVIEDFSAIFEKTAESYGFIGRNGGNEFITVIKKCSHEKADSLVGNLQKAIEAYNAQYPDSTIIVRSNYVLYDECPCETFSELISKAYAQRM